LCQVQYIEMKVQTPSILRLDALVLNGPLYSHEMLVAQQ
jgi:hypothetical protein